MWEMVKCGRCGNVGDVEMHSNAIRNDRMQRRLEYYTTSDDRNLYIVFWLDTNLWWKLVGVYRKHVLSPFNQNGGFQHHDVLTSPCQCGFVLHLERALPPPSISSLTEEGGVKLRKAGHKNTHLVQFGIDTCRPYVNVAFAIKRRLPLKYTTTL